MGLILIIYTQSTIFNCPKCVIESSWKNNQVDAGLYYRPSCYNAYSSLKLIAKF